MEYRILGPLEVAHARRTLPLGEPRHRKLLAALLLHADELVSADWLIDALWGPGPPRSAAAMLHVRICELRAALRAGSGDYGASIVTRSGGYELQTGAGDLDSRQFERLATAGTHAFRRGNLTTAGASLQEALGLWRGPPLLEVADEPFAEAEIARLEALHLHVLETAMEVELALGHHGDILAELGKLVTGHPMHERFWSQLMLAQYRTGRQGDALQSYQVVRQLLSERLGVDPGAALQRMHGAILRQDPALDAPPPSPSGTPPDAPPNNMPEQATAFIGREWELAEVRALLHTARLVTLVGVSGAGKSRLALEAATRGRHDFPDGAWLVDLETLKEPGLVIHAVADTLGVREHPERRLPDDVVEYLRAAQMLLILDGCDELLDEVADLCRLLLPSCGRLSILTTGRRPLNIAAERVRPLPGLPVPPADATTIDAVEAADACRLLVQRAAAVDPGFRLEPLNAAAVARICRRVDGLPLAIELAAAGVHAMDVNQLAGRLDDRFRELGAAGAAALPSERTLEFAFNATYEQLAVRERALFDRLAVFVGGFTIEAAEHVCSWPDDDTVTVAPLVDRLLDQGLLLDDSTPRGQRYRMLETIRGYALTHIDRSEGQHLRQAHAAYFVSITEPAAQTLRWPEQQAWQQRLELEHSNIRSALQWSIQHGLADTAVRLAGSVYPFWDLLHGHYSEDRRWLTHALNVPGAVPPAARARALLGATSLAVIQGDLEHSAVVGQEAVALFRQAGDPAGLAHAMQYLGLGAIFAGELERATALFEESLTKSQQAGDPWLVGWALTFLAATALAGGQHERAVMLAVEGEKTARTDGDPECVPWAQLVNVMASCLAGDRTAAAALLREAVVALRDFGAHWGLSIGLFLSAQWAGARGDLPRMAALLGASEALRTSVGAIELPFIASWLRDDVARTRAALGEDAFTNAWQAGQSLPLIAAVAEALRNVEEDLVAAPSAHRPR